LIREGGDRITTGAASSHIAVRHAGVKGAATRRKK
jgi:hypothetical protein